MTPFERLTFRLIWVVLAAGSTTWVNLGDTWPWRQTLIFFAGWAAALGAIRLADEVYKRRHRADDGAP